MKRIKLEDQPNSPFSQGFLIGTRLHRHCLCAGSAVVTWADRLSTARLNQWQPSAAEVPALAESEPR